LLVKHLQHKLCLKALEESSRPFTYAHALAETFATLTGFYKVPNDVAAELTLALRGRITVEPLLMEDYTAAICEARPRGIMGGGIYDSLHATFARRKGAERVITRNTSDFTHAAPELLVTIP